MLRTVPRSNIVALALLALILAVVQAISVSHDGVSKNYLVEKAEAISVVKKIRVVQHAELDSNPWGAGFVSPLAFANCFYCSFAIAASKLFQSFDFVCFNVSKRKIYKFLSKLLLPV